jgi:hypothetical protein
MAPTWKTAGNHGLAERDASHHLRQVTRPAQRADHAPNIAESVAGLLRFAGRASATALDGAEEHPKHAAE